MTTRKKFKPEQLCSEIDKLLVDLASNVASLKYSVNVLAISKIQEPLRSMGNYDQALYHQYDDFRSELLGIADAITQAKPSKRAALVAHANSTIIEVQGELQSAVRSIRKAKSAILEVA